MQDIEMWMLTSVETPQCKLSYLRQTSICECKVHSEDLEEDCVHTKLRVYMNITKQHSSRRREVAHSAVTASYVQTCVQHGRHLLS